jgi:SAM-dependent methyltransferase
VSSTQNWEDAAAGWERQRAFLAAVGAPVTARLVEVLAPRPHETILELACGNGEVGLAIAPLLTNGELIQSDVEPAMVAAAKREADLRGFNEISHRVLDAERLDLPDGSVDGVVCRFGYMLVDDPVAALAESRRVLRRGGRIALAVWAESTHNPWGTTVGRVLLEHGVIDPPRPDTPGPFRLGAPGSLEGAIERAGLTLVGVDDVPIVWKVPTVSDFWTVTLDLSNVTRTAFAELEPGQRANVQRDAEAALGPYVTSDGVTLPGLARVAQVVP